jgi:integrase
MMLREAIEQYILWRQAHGAKFVSDAGVLRRFLGYADGDAACDAVTKAQVLAFLAGKGPLTRYRENKYCALGGFWRYAISRDLASRSPLPDNEPRSPVRAPPYIYSRDELKRLFDPAAVALSRRGARQLDAVTFRTLLVLLYGAGLRLGEAMRLALPDVDLPEAVLTIRATKFYKSRLVPIGPHLAAVLKAYMPLRQRGSPPQGDRSFPTGRRRGGSANMPCFCSSTIPGRASPKRSS